MSIFAQHGRQPADNRASGRRAGQACATAVALIMTLVLPLALAPEADAQSNSGIFINNDVLNNLGPGPGAAPITPFAPAAPATPYAPQPQLQLRPPATGGLSFEPQGSGNFVVTRPGTLLFPPLQAPSSTLAPGFAGTTDNGAARSEALNNAFAEGPEPTSQLLIPLEGTETANNDSVQVFHDRLPPADPNAVPGTAPVLTLRLPPQPAPRKPEVPARMMAEIGLSPASDTTAELAPEFQTPEAPAAAEPPAETPMAETPVETAPVEEAVAVTMSEPAEPAAPAPVAEAPESQPQSNMAQSSAPRSEAPMSSADVPAPTVMVKSPAEEAVAPQASAAAPVSLLPADNGATASDEAAPAAMSQAAEAPAAMPASRVETSDLAAATSGNSGLQTASLTVGGAVEDLSFVFDSDSAELSDQAQAELRSLADSLRSNDADRIQVLGFAGEQSGSQDLARKLALSRALKVRTFLIDAGVPSARIQVRSLGDQSDGGPANRVDIRPIGS